MAGNPDNLLGPGAFAPADPDNPLAPQVLGSQLLTRGAANLLWRAAKSFGSDVADLVTTPGRVLTGEATPYPGYSNSIDPAAYAARLAGYGMGFGRAMPAPTGSVGMFAGP